MCNLIGGNVFYSGSGAGETAWQGNDPILGPPFAPIDYQMFVTPLRTDQFAGNSPPVHIYWTIPDVSNYVYSRVTLFRLFFPSYSVWFSDSSNPATAQRGIDPDVNSGAPGWIGKANFIWLTGPAGTPPTQPGSPISGGNTFAGNIRAFGDTDPGTMLSFVAWTPDTIDHFTLERGRNDFCAGNVSTIFSNIPLSAACSPTPGNPIVDCAGTGVDDTSVRDANTSYFYRLTGFTTGGLVFPYNTVAVIHPYTLTIDPNARDANNNRVTLLTWNGPTPTELAAWPTAVNNTCPSPIPFATGSFVNSHNANCPVGTPNYNHIVLSWPLPGSQPKNYLLYKSSDGINWTYIYTFDNTTQVFNTGIYDDCDTTSPTYYYFTATLNDNTTHDSTVVTITH